MRLMFAGTPEPAVAALERLLASDHEIVAVLTRPDARKGRGRSLYPSPVKALAQTHGIPVFTPSTLRAGTPDGDQFRSDLAALNIDCAPVVAYGNLIPADLLDAVPHGWVNLHFSLLPRWRGAAPVQAAIAAGDTTTGATTFRIDEGLDTGPILASLTEPIMPEDTADDLLTRLAYAGSDLLVATMNQLAAGTATLQPQVGESTHAAKILSSDAQIQWNTPAAEIDRNIRAVTPAPGAWTTLDSDRVKLGKVLPLAETSQDAPGTIRIEKTRVVVATATQDVALTTIQVPGKKMMNAIDWARGRHTTEGLLFS
ncbi:methionyl-tRNA formyltransferase [Corynebacterium sp. HS2168-gen11]|uniref:methionyl-tRNA formyltransferase n=1 Tax=Corynebacterium sp. HS2168-gen11 TaxID=2974027 RepID=UPI00216AEC15|nr:methionyl-tRNA formyltransferase [Corynebacterium sp. HS2168-gen11]MCS4535146.1 methionyl-tRNA formyltransferase [Corynebacterium sp. HS2168-gen11]